MSLSIIETTGALGAEISGVDLSQPLDDATFEQIRQAFFRHGVICFRGSEFSDADHIRFSARWGEVRKLAFDPNDLRTGSGIPEICVISNVLDEQGKHIGTYDSGLFWHTDGSFYANNHTATLLHALEIPEQDGRTLGDTMFASVAAAYDALPENMKKRLAGLQALHTVLKRREKTLEAGVDSWRTSDHRKQHLDTVLASDDTAAKKVLEAVHPVVRVHPVTGRKCLYVTDAHTSHIVGLPEDESRDLLAELTAHIIKPEFLYRHNWRVHDLLMWDDCSTQHKATFDYKLPQRRVMHRTIVL